MEVRSCLARLCENAKRETVIFRLTLVLSKQGEDMPSPEHPASGAGVGLASWGGSVMLLTRIGNANVQRKTED